MATAVQSAPSADTEHLKIIQAVIVRLAQNSFQAKQWSVALVTGILALGSRSAQTASYALAFFPAICFWILDAYYLRQERLFRALYRAAAAGYAPKFAMDTHPYRDSVASWLATMWSPAVLLVHGVVMLLVAIVVMSKIL